MKLIGKIFITLYGAAAALLVASAAAVLALLLFGVRPYVVLTGSMEPAIPQGSICFVSSRASFTEVSSGDVIAFRMGSLLVTHRAVRVDENGITTRGDANNAEDMGDKVAARNYIGKVIFCMPSVGKALLYARTVRGRIVVIGAFALFIAAGPLCDRLTESLRKDNRKKDSQEEDNLEEEPERQ